MFIQTEAMPDSARMKFFPGENVLAAGPAEFLDEEAAKRSPVAIGVLTAALIIAISLGVSIQQGSSRKYKS